MKKRAERENVISLTVHDDEKSLIEKAAAAVGLATAAFVRSKAVEAARVVLHQKAENTP